MNTGLLLVAEGGGAGDGGGAGASALAGLMNPPVLFFFLGMLAAIVKSNLRIPKAVTKLLSLYLLWAIGFKGGVEIAHSPLGREAALCLAAGIFMALVVPLYSFFLLKKKVGVDTAAALAATYGSISAVTFMTACSVLDARGIGYDGHMVAAMALMESPAIVVAVLLLRAFEGKGDAVAALPAESKQKKPSWGVLMHEAFLNGPVLLLMGSLAIGMITGDRGYQAFKPLVSDAFSGVLVFFLLDLGILAAKKLRSLKDGGLVTLVAFATVIPVLNALAAIGLARVLELREGNAMLLAVLCGSASYIAVPAAARIAIPKAQPSIYLTMALGITFPFNLGIGIPMYVWIVQSLWK